MLLNCIIKDVIWRGVISYNSFKLLLNTIILKDKAKDKELVFFAIAKHLLQSKKGLFLLLLI